MKLNYRRTICIGFAFLSICSFWQMYDSIIPLILQNTFHLSETLIGIVMSADNILAVFLLPLVGSLSDRVNSPLGKRTPFIIGGSLIAIIFMLLLPYADAHANLILFIIALGVTLFSMALYRTPAVALMPDLTPKPLRSKANAVINLMGALGGVYTLVLIRTLVASVENPSYTKVFFSVAFIMIVAVSILLITVKENEIAITIKEEYPEELKEEEKIEKEGLSKPVKKSLRLILVSIFLWFTAYNAVTTAFSRYAINVWGMLGGGFARCLMVATISAVLSYIPIGIIASSIGRKKTIMIGICCMIVCYSGALFYPHYHPTVNILFVLIGFGWAAIGVNSLPMVVEIAKGSDIGRYTGFYYTFSMSAQIMTPILSGALMQHISYRVLFPYAVFFMILAFITMSFVKHGDSKPLPKKTKLEHFDLDD